MESEKHVFFVRHGQSEANVDSIARGAVSKLTDKGLEQTKAVAERIQKFDIDTLIASPYVRTQQTAEAIAERTGLPIETSELFTERRQASERIGRALHDPGVKDMEEKMFDGYAIPGHRYSDEENFDDLKERACAALDFLAGHEGKRLCVVTHGMFLRIMLCAAIYGPTLRGEDMQHFIHSFETANTGICYLRYTTNPWAKPGEPNMEWRVISVNDIAHFG